MTSASPALPVVDIDRVLCDLNSEFNPLHRDFLLDYHVAGVRDGYVYLSIALPEGMTRVFVSMLESMTGFFRFIDIKARSASAVAKVHDPAHRAESERLQAAFQEKACEIFDGFIGQGLDVKEAVKRTNSTLKASGSPWATFETVQKVLRSAGRFRLRKKVKS